MKFAYHKTRTLKKGKPIGRPKETHYMIRDDECLGKNCFNPKTLKSRSDRSHPIIGSGYETRRYMNPHVINVCATMYEDGWRCPRALHYKDLQEKREKEGWEIREW